MHTAQPVAGTGVHHWLGVLKNRGGGDVMFCANVNAISHQRTRSPSRMLLVASEAPLLVRTERLAQ
eukprot:scaffold253931_cov36-Tisochrysis_lutea.AAC.2